MENADKLPYFSPLLPWQQNLWQQLTTSAQQSGHLPHALLASGMIGIGKRAFVWRWVAWQLCHKRSNNLQGACGQCESCQWLEAGTHPDLSVLPITRLLKSHEHEAVERVKSKKTKKSNQSNANKAPKLSIKVDDIRSIHDFVNQGSGSMRICVFDEADTMTIGAANALLKTLEEPNRGVQLILITDKPDLLLPTIKSRVQQLPLTDISHQQAIDYVKTELANFDLSGLNHEMLEDGEQVRQLLDMSANAPLQAVLMAKSEWYGLRELWLTTWTALRFGSRSAISASEYWQTQISLAEFIQLTQLMLLDIQRFICGFVTYQQDINFATVETRLPTLNDCYDLQASIHAIQKSVTQNLQEKIAYDEIMTQLSRF